jgi:hypothetical protein
MKRVWHTPAKVVAGLFVAALYAMPQAYTISARPGVINYIEGSVSKNDSRLSSKTVGRTFLATNDTLSTDKGKAEVLLTPGVFLRVGADSEIRMVSPSLTKTVVEVIKGEAFVEAAELTKDNDIQVLDHGATTRLLKPGLYKFGATDQPIAAVILGKAEVQMGDRKVDLGKNRQTVLTSELKPQKFDSKKEDNADDLYAWSEVRDQYEAASSFASARTAYASTYNTGLWNNGYSGNGYYGGNGFGMGYGPGWAWNAGFNSWAWLPADGAFFSPFGYGFFAPGVVAYAPVAYLPGGGGGGRTIAVPVNPQKPPVIAGLSGNSANSGNSAGLRPSRPSRPAIYTTTGAAYRGGPVTGAGPGSHMSGNNIAGAARGSYSGNPSAASSRGSANSGGYRGGGGGASAPSGNVSHGGGMSGGGGMSSGGAMSRGSSGGGARR